MPSTTAMTGADASEGANLPAEGAAAAEDEAAKAAAAATEADEDAGEADGADGEPAEGEKPDADKTPEQIAAEAEAKKAADEKFAAELPELLKKIPEPELKKLGQKYANSTMAAARRAETRTKAAVEENAKLKATAAQHATFVEELQTNPQSAIRKAGYKNVREFIDRCAGSDEPAEPDRLSDIEKKLKDREEREAAERTAAQVEASKKAVADAVGGDPKRWALVAKPRGQRDLWDAIVDYHRAHGSCPDEAVYALADEIEKDLRAEFGAPSTLISGQGQPAKTATTPAPATAAPGAKNSGKTLTNRGSSGAPAVTELSNDPDEARAQALEQLRAEGLL
jgi:hypothetical protein